MNNIQMNDATKQKVIVGRSSNADIERRLNIGILLIINYDFKSKSDFICKYKKTLSSKGLQVPSEKTISNDIQKMQKTLADKGIILNTRKWIKTSEFDQIDDSIKGTIKHVKFSVNGHESTLYDKEHEIYLKAYKKFKDPFYKLYKKKAIILKTKTSQLRHYPMVHLYIITCDQTNSNYNTSLSTYITNLFLKYTRQEVLYVSAHHNCAEIVFYKKNYNLILFHAFCLTRAAHSNCNS